ncbi:MAG: outer membrane beta-barrel protein [Gemmatimonadales bacterium]|nr:outer membrane beta-barrel protein [Gemmatimonadales bacterium]NIN50133.1 outer membrane beta-barrel protein [Gemmatimonadales bacterium]NIP07597.1 outer membrane beta-barrel protein [Gemmatimonadales bacterium]NIR01749.1 outer membrane beta-barrel protein [Gemmatimonadales bacterium]NIS65652.1 outer membrane beta-barrel protein [Gemmatimonadales bacterium]
MIAWRSCLLVLTALAACTVPLAAQAEQRRGFWVGAGLGGGAAGIDIPAVGDVGKLGLSGYVNIGGTVRPAVLLGVEGIGWLRSDPDTTRQLGMLSAVVSLYPLADKDFFFVKAGFGAAFYAENASQDAFRAYGFAFHAGVGGDYRLSEKILLGLLVQYVRSPNQEVKRNRQILFGKLDFEMIQFSLGVRWHKRGW